MSKKRDVTSIFSIFIIQIFIVYCFECISKATFLPEVSLSIFVIATVLTFIIFTFVWVLLNKAHIAYLICFIIAFILSCVSYFKFVARGVPLYFSDVVYAFKVFGVTDKSNIILTPYMVIFFTMGLFVFLYIKNLNLKPTFIKNRSLSLSILSTIIIVFFMLNSCTLNSTTIIAKDDSYINNYLDKLETNIKTKKSSKTKPNVIMILSESFWNIDSLNTLQLSSDPIPNFKKLSQDSISGDLNTTTFGGGTADVEFEVLTGMINSFMGTTGTVYETMLKNPTLSLASIFMENGYRPIGIHTYNKNFYNRDKALPLLGFDEFIGLEDLENPLYDGNYVSDSVLTDLIINNFESSNEPVFIFAISMENHQTYTKDKYEQTPIQVLNKDIPKQLKQNVETYLTGLNHADKELGRLAEYFKSQDKQATLMFFGDHQPTLGPNFGLYQYTNEIKDVSHLTTDDYYKVLHTPFLIWSNYKTETAFVPSIGTNFIGNYLLNYVELQKPLFYYFLDETYQSFHYASRKELFIDKENKRYDHVPEQYKQITQLYDTFQKKLLFGSDNIKERLETLQKTD